MTEFQKKHKEKLDSYKNKRIREQAYALSVYSNMPREDLQKLYFVNYGCINFKSDDFHAKLQLARDLHQIDAEKHPELHDIHEEEPFRCYHRTICKCGFCEENDSSD